jgi:hypothetical protein
MNYSQSSGLHYHKIRPGENRDGLDFSKTLVIAKQGRNNEEIHSPHFSPDARHSETRAKQ